MQTTIISVSIIAAFVIIIFILFKFFRDVFNRRYDNVKYIIKELALTLSTKPSLISSKKLERFLFVIVYTTLTIFWIWHRRNEMTTAEFVMVVSPLMIYAGFSTTMIRKDKLDDKAVTQNSDNGNT